mmetsp:Transcript_86324/g.140153  ORF Transcript_86324/g.140153 Transcript_86324/m.140153 type:complete len:562 (+) Transcript_86324:2330-4015(+)
MGVELHVLATTGIVDAHVQKEWGVLSELKIFQRCRLVNLEHSVPRRRLTSLGIGLRIKKISEHLVHGCLDSQFNLVGHATPALEQNAVEPIAADSSKRIACNLLEACLDKEGALVSNLLAVLVQNLELELSRFGKHILELQGHLAQQGVGHLGFAAVVDQDGDLLVGLLAHVNLNFLAEDKVLIPFGIAVVFNLSGSAPSFANIRGVRDVAIDIGLATQHRLGHAGGLDNLQHHFAKVVFLGHSDSLDLLLVCTVNLRGAVVGHQASILNGDLDTASLTVGKGEPVLAPASTRLGGLGELSHAQRKFAAFIIGIQRVFVHELELDSLGLFVCDEELVKLIPLAVVSLGCVNRLGLALSLATRSSLCSNDNVRVKSIVQLRLLHILGLKNSDTQPGYRCFFHRRVRDDPAGNHFNPLFVRKHQYFLESRANDEINTLLNPRERVGAESTQGESKADLGLGRCSQLQQRQRLRRIIREVRLNPDGKIDLEIVHRHRDTQPQFRLRANLDAKVTRGNPAEVCAQLQIVLAAGGEDAQLVEVGSLVADRHALQLHRDNRQLQVCE